MTSQDFDLVGIPWVKGGRDKTGFDCGGLARAVLMRMGKDVPDFNTPDDDEEYEGELYANLSGFDEIDRPEYGALVTFSMMRTPDHVTHVGVVIDDGKSVIHVMRKSMSRIERLSKIQWGILRGIYRWK